jgi:hypothetical protein
MTLRQHVSEFLCVGGLSLLLLPLLIVYRKAVGLETAEAGLGFVMFQLAMFINNPHFAVSYLLFYKGALGRAFGRVFSPAQRLRYWGSGLVVPALLLAWLVAALATHSARRLGFALQLMFVLVGWHYVKQGFGVVMVLSQRRGVSFTRFERNALLAHCLAGWLYARTNPADPGRLAEVDGVQYSSIAHPGGLSQVTTAILALCSLTLIVALVRFVRRTRRAPPLVPLLGFLITVWAWTICSRIDPLFIYVIPALHGLQYLYFVVLLRTGQARRDDQFAAWTRALLPLSLGAVVLGWFLFRGAPEFLDTRLVLQDPIDPFGPTPYLAAISCFVNIHHYFMDAVMWRRENPELSVLFAPRAQPELQ